MSQRCQCFTGFASGLRKYLDFSLDKSRTWVPLFFQRRVAASVSWPRARKPCTLPYRAPVHRPTKSTTTSKAERDTAYNQRRVSSSAAGYDRDWQKARLAHLAREPLCRFCMERGLLVQAVPVDHIIPIEERPDLRLVDSNLRSLCTPCHNAHTMQQLAAKRRGS